MRIWLYGHCKEILFWRCSSGELSNCWLYTRRLEYIIDGKIEAFKIKYIMWMKPVCWFLFNEQYRFRRKKVPDFHCFSFSMCDLSYMISSTCFRFHFTGKGASFFFAIVPTHYFDKCRRTLLTVEFHVRNEKEHFIVACLRFPQNVKLNPVLQKDTM